MGFVTGEIASGFLMSHHLDRIDWMPSPPLVPDLAPIDFTHLRKMTLGDDSLEREVLGMFSAQSSRLLDALANLPADSAALAHTLKGSARAIGAFEVADAAAYLEAQINTGADTTAALVQLDGAITQACAAIDAVLRQA